VKAKKPYPWGYGSSIQDTSLSSGHLLVGFLDAYNAKPDSFLYDNCKKLFKALKFIYSVSSVPGLVPRGPHPDDKTAYYDDASMDQVTTYIISLSRYANSSIADEEEKEFIKKSLQEVGERLEKYGWSIKRADGITETHVGFAWTGFVPEHASILLPTLLALYKGTGNKHWNEVYENFSAENDSLRWEKLKTSNIRISSHPIYANQNCFRMNAFYRFEKNPERKKVIYDYLGYATKLQLERDFPGDWFRNYFKDFDWKKLAEVCEWRDNSLHGCDSALEKFKPEIFEVSGDIRGMAILSHVRFPLGGFHMVMTSEHKELIKEYVPKIWSMMNTVDLEKISGETGGEVSNLLIIVSLHLYDYYFSQKNSKGEKK